MTSKIEAISEITAQMQSLCGQVENDARSLREFNKAFSRIAARHKKLRTFYQNDWVKIMETIENHPEIESALLQMAPPGQYSILAQDTIWDALDDIHQETTALLKKAAQVL